MLNYLQIDNLIAEKVMGWELLEVNYAGTPEQTPRHIELEQWMEDVGLKEVGYFWIDVSHNIWEEFSGQSRWNPSNNIVHAWRVIREFTNDDYDWELLNYGSEYIFRITEKASGMTYWDKNDNICRAVCYAALWAKGIRYEDSERDL